jgi:hypothetical protein
MQLIQHLQEEIILPSTFDRNIVFHFNKMHLQDSSVPMWVVKVKGQTYYVHHLDSLIGFSTKQTPDNIHTKGSLKFKGIIEIKLINNEIIATIK